MTCDICEKPCKRCYVEIVQGFSINICDICFLFIKNFRDKIYLYCTNCDNVCICDRDLLMKRDLHLDACNDINYISPSSVISVVKECYYCSGKKITRQTKLVSCDRFKSGNRTR